MKRWPEVFTMFAAILVLYAIGARAETGLESSALVDGAVLAPGDDGSIVLVCTDCVTLDVSDEASSATLLAIGEAELDHLTFDSATPSDDDAYITLTDLVLESPRCGWGATWNEEEGACEFTLEIECGAATADPMLVHVRGPNGFRQDVLVPPCDPEAR